MAKEKMTLDKLARMMQREFSKSGEENKKAHAAFSGKIGSIDGKVGQLNKKFDYLEKRIDGVERKFEGRFDEVDKNFSDLFKAVDSYAKKADTYFQEMLVLAKKVERQEIWIRQIAEKVGVELKY